MAMSADPAHGDGPVHSPYGIGEIILGRTMHNPAPDVPIIDLQGVAGQQTLMRRNPEDVDFVAVLARHPNGEIHLGVTHDGSLMWWRPSTFSAQRRLWSYLSGYGSYKTAGFVVVSNKRQNAEGWIQGVSATPDFQGASSEFVMFAVSPDGNGPTHGAEAHSLASALADPAQFGDAGAFAAYDLGDIHSGGTIYGKGYGRKKYNLWSCGAQGYGADLVNQPAVNADVITERLGAGVWGLSRGSFGIKNVAAEPPTPAGGGTFFVQAGALKYKGSAGTVTTVAPA